ncbi:MAG: DUF1194 domain-containing protein [Pseudomonadota bacterium]
MGEPMGRATWGSWTALTLRALVAVMAFLGALGVLSGLGPWGGSLARAQAVVDLQLVLAVDVSQSMDQDEQFLQRSGYVAAFRDKAVQKAILSGKLKRIAVAYLEWGGANEQRLVVDWTLIDSPAAANAFAQRLAVAPISRFRLTSISSALAYAEAMLGASPYPGARRVIDVSGDGYNNSGGPVEPARDRLIANGIAINGLPIILRSRTSTVFNRRGDLDEYYAACVIGGPGAFVIAVRHPDEFATAIKRKLILEISSLENRPPWRVRGPRRWAAHDDIGHIIKQVQAQTATPDVDCGDRRRY